MALLNRREFLATTSLLSFGLGLPILADAAEIVGKQPGKKTQGQRSKPVVSA